MRRTSPRAVHRQTGARGDLLELVRPVVPPVRRLAQPGDLVEGLVDRLVHHGVEHHDATSRRQHAQEFLQCRHRLGQQVEGVATHDEVELAVLVRQGVEVDEGEGDVDEAQLGRESLALLEHVRQLVGGLDGRDVGGDGEAGHAGAGGVVEHGVGGRRPGQVDEQVDRRLTQLFHGFSLRRPGVDAAGPSSSSAVGDGEDGTRHAETDTDLVAVDPGRLAVVAGDRRRARSRWPASRP